MTQNAPSPTEVEIAPRGRGANRKPKTLPATSIKNQAAQATTSLLLSLGLIRATKMKVIGGPRSSATSTKKNASTGGTPYVWGQAHSTGRFTIYAVQAVGRTGLKRVFLCARSSPWQGTGRKSGSYRRHHPAPTGASFLSTSAATYWVVAVLGLWYIESIQLFIQATHRQATHRSFETTTSRVLRRIEYSVPGSLRSQAIPCPSAVIGRTSWRPRTDPAFGSESTNTAPSS